MGDQDWRAALATRYGIEPTVDVMRAEVERRGWSFLVPPALDETGRATCRLSTGRAREVIGHGATADEALADALVQVTRGEGPP